MRLEPDIALTHEFLGNALVALDRKAAAAAHYQRALQIEPDNERVRQALEALSASH